MIKIKLTNEIGGKKAITFGIIMVSIVMFFFVLLIIFNPQSANILGIISTIELTGITAIILFLTLQAYVTIIEVSEQTLSFTKTQTTFNTFFDNFKYFDDLAKRKTLFASDGGLFEMEKHFENISFDSLQTNLIDILKHFPKKTKDARYEISFRKTITNIQSLIDIIYDEVQRIRNSNYLSDEQKTNLITLYKIFTASDYINFCHLLVLNIEFFDNEKLPHTQINNLLNCNKNKINLDPKTFLKLYYEIEKSPASPATN